MTFEDYRRYLLACALDAMWDNMQPGSPPTLKVA